MGKLLKSFLRGLLYIFALPGLLVLLAFYCVIGLVVFVYIGIKAGILFFSGRNIFGDLPEDILAKQKLNKDNPEEEKPEDNNPPSSSSYTTYLGPLETPFLAPPNIEPKKESEQENNEPEGEDK